MILYIEATHLNLVCIVHLVYSAYVIKSIYIYHHIHFVVSITILFISRIIDPLVICLKVLLITAIAINFENPL